MAAEKQTLRIPALNRATELETIEMAALGRPLYPGMLYDCRKDSFIPGVTLWDETSLKRHLDTHTDLKFSSSDSISDKFSLLNVSASLKASFMGGLVEVDGSAKYLHDTKSSTKQSRVTMFYSETSKFEQLTMTQPSQITYPQVFDQKTATHVVTAVLYGAHAFMVFEQNVSEYEDKQDVGGDLKAIVRKIPRFSIDGKGAVQMKNNEKRMAEKIRCTFYGDYHLEQNPTTYIGALQVYKQLPTLLKDKPQNAIPIKVWLYPLCLLDPRAARLGREISTNLVSYIEDIMEELGEVERKCKDLLDLRITQVKAFSDIKERLHSFQNLLNLYKLVFQKKLCSVLPAIRDGEMEKSLEDILNIHNSSFFEVSRLNQWLDQRKSEINILSSNTKFLKEIRTEDSDGRNTILFNPDVDVVVCLTFTSLQCDDPYLSTLGEFLKSEEFEKLDGKQSNSVACVKWFDDPDVITKMSDNLSHFKSFSEANKDNGKMRFIISAISDTSRPGSSIYLYIKTKLTDTQFLPVSKPPPPLLRNIQHDSVSLKLQKSPTGNTVQYRVEYKEVKPEGNEQWLVTDTNDEHFTLTGLETGKQYLLQYRIVGIVGVSEATHTVPFQLSTAQPVIVGGTGGDDFSWLLNPLQNSRPTKITISYKLSDTFSTIQVNFISGQIIKVGLCPGEKEMQFQFEQQDKITAATLWPNNTYTRIAGLEFVVAKSNGKEVVLSVKCAMLGKPVKLDVKSGKFFGIKGRCGDDIDALGFYFI